MGRRSRNGATIWIGLGLEVAAAVIGGTLLGQWVDGHLGTTPAALLAGSFLGFGAAVFRILTVLKWMNDGRSD